MVYGVRNTPTKKRGGGFEGQVSMGYSAENHCFTGPAASATEIAGRKGWSIESFDENSAELSAKGMWRTYQMRIRWLESENAFQLDCLFDLRPAEGRVRALRETLEMINEDLLFGCFVLRERDGTVAFRSALPLEPAEDGLSDRQILRLIDFAVDSCDQCYPAIRVAASTAQTPQQAIHTAIFSTAGSA